MACFVYDGIDFGDILEVASVEMPAIPSTSPDLRYSTGRDGAVLAGNALEPLEITVKARLATKRIDDRDIQRAWARVAAMLRTDGPRPLYLTEGIYRMAVLSGDTSLDFKTYSATADLTFLCADPVAYGRERLVTVPSGGSVTFCVGGTYRAAPEIAASAVRDSEALVWGLRLDGGDFIHVATGSGSARSVAVDCGGRTCLVNGDPSLPTLDSDWLALEPGTHVLEMDKGTGAATVTYRERWL